MKPLLPVIISNNAEQIQYLTGRDLHFLWLCVKEGYLSSGIGINDKVNFSLPS
jgi:hypothetical protein